MLLRLASNVGVARRNLENAKYVHFKHAIQFRHTESLFIPFHATVAITYHFLHIYFCALLKVPAQSIETALVLTCRNT